MLAQDLNSAPRSVTAGSTRVLCCRFKCFCQGVVYGLNLKTEVLRSREALCAALRSCLEDERYKQVWPMLCC